MNEQLLGYVKDGLARGIKKEALAVNLLKVGWQQALIDEAFAQVAQAPSPGAPAMSAETSPVQDVGGNTSGMGKDSVIPPGVSGWGWGPVLLTWIWGVFHNVWISLLIFIPFVGWIMWII